jgi:hypothetical protein
VPEWIERPLGRYYLYFGHHDGRYIRLAFADTLLGPWHTHEPGVLPLHEAGFEGHVASPDVHVVEERREIRLYFHGSDTKSGGGGEQSTRVALSRDGLAFSARPGDLAPPYLRAFPRDGWWYALVMPGILHRSPDGLEGFERGPALFDDEMRHAAVRPVDGALQVFYTNIGDRPERILAATVNVGDDWRSWSASAPVTVLTPERDYEGAGLPQLHSLPGRARWPVHQLRDPAVFAEGDRTYLLYSVAGEQGIALAEVHDPPSR